MAMSWNCWDHSWEFHWLSMPFCTRMVCVKLASASSSWSPLEKWGTFQCTVHPECDKNCTPLPMQPHMDSCVEMLAVGSWIASSTGCTAAIAAIAFHAKSHKSSVYHGVSQNFRPSIRAGWIGIPASNLRNPGLHHSHCHHCYHCGHSLQGSHSPQGGGKAFKNKLKTRDTNYETLTLKVPIIQYATWGWTPCRLNKHRSIKFHWTNQCSS